MKPDNEICIDVATPEYHGAPCPAFDEKSVNESRFEDSLRAKSWSVTASNGVGYVDWLSQECEDPSEAWEAELKRAFKANGFTGVIHVKFGSRDSGHVHNYDMHAN